MVILHIMGMAIVLMRIPMVTVHMDMTTDIMVWDMDTLITIVFIALITGVFIWALVGIMVDTMADIMEAPFMAKITQAITEGENGPAHFHQIGIIMLVLFQGLPEEIPIIQRDKTQELPLEPHQAIRQFLLMEEDLLHQMQTHSRELLPLTEHRARIQQEMKRHAVSQQTRGLRQVADPNITV